MPAKSKKQANLMRAALGGATFPKAKEVRASMTKEQLKDFSTMEHESYQYDFRKRNNLKQHQPKEKT